MGRREEVSTTKWSSTNCGLAGDYFRSSSVGLTHANGNDCFQGSLLLELEIN
jgi:hypothetical protein